MSYYHHIRKMLYFGLNLVFVHVRRSWLISTYYERPALGVCKALEFVKFFINIAILLKFGTEQFYMYTNNNLD